MATKAFDPCGSRVPSKPTPPPDKVLTWPGMELDTISTVGESARQTTTPVPRRYSETQDLESLENEKFGTVVTHDDMTIMKDHLREIFSGVLSNAPRKKIDRTLPPKYPPKETTTTRRRMEVMKHKLIVRCTGFIEMIENYNKLMLNNDPKYFGELRNAAMSKTTDQLEYEFELQDFLNLKSLAVRAVQQDMEVARENATSKMRLRGSRGEPVISTQFRDNFVEYGKPPYMPVGRHIKRQARFLPKIDSAKEVWLVPTEAEDEHSLTAMSEVIVNLKNLPTRSPNDTRSKREIARPPLRKASKPAKKDGDQPQSPGSGKDSKGTKVRPPWKYAM